MKNHFSLKNIDKEFKGVESMGKRERNLIAPNETDFTDIESISSFKNVDQNFEDYNLTAKQANHYNKINSRFSKSLKSDMFADDYGFEDLGMNNKKKAKSKAVKSNSVIDEKMLTEKGSRPVRSKHMSPLSRRLRSPYSDRAVKSMELSDLDTFVQSKGIHHMAHARKLKKIPNAQKMESFDDLDEFMSDIKDFKKDTDFPKANEPGKKKALFGKTETNKIARKLKKTAEAKEVKTKILEEKKDKGNDEGLELLDAGEIDKAVSEMASEDAENTKLANEIADDNDNL